MSLCHPSTQLPLPVSPATRRGRLDAAACTCTSSLAMLKAGESAFTGTVKIIPDEVGAP